MTRSDIEVPFLELPIFSRMEFLLSAPLFPHGQTRSLLENPCKIKKTFCFPYYFPFFNSPKAFFVKCFVPKCINALHSTNPTQLLPGRDRSPEATGTGGHFTSLEMEEKRLKKRGKNNFRKNRKEAVEEIEVEIESIVEEEIIEVPDEPEEEEDTSKQDMIDTIATQLEMTEEDVLQEYEQFYQKYPEGEISKAMFIEENMVRYLEIRTYLALT